MSKVPCRRDRLPRWLLVSADLLLVFILGFIDYATGDYSILAFYMIPVALGSWFIGARFGICLAVISGFVRFCADYQTFVDVSFVRYWNVTEDALFLLITAAMTALLRLTLERNDAYCR